MAKRKYRLQAGSAIEVISVTWEDGNPSNGMLNIKFALFGQNATPAIRAAILNLLQPLNFVKITEMQNEFSGAISRMMGSIPNMPIPIVCRDISKFREAIDKLQQNNYLSAHDRAGIENIIREVECKLSEAKKTTNEITPQGVELLHVLVDPYLPGIVSAHDNPDVVWRLCTAAMINEFFRDQDKKSGRNIAAEARQSGRIPEGLIRMLEVLKSPYPAELQAFIKQANITDTDAALIESIRALNRLWEGKANLESTFDRSSGGKIPSLELQKIAISKMVLSEYYRQFPDLTATQIATAALTTATLLAAVDYKTYVRWSRMPTHVVNIIESGFPDETFCQKALVGGQLSSIQLHRIQTAFNTETLHNAISSASYELAVTTSKTAAQHYREEQYGEAVLDFHEVLCLNVLALGKAAGLADVASAHHSIAAVSEKLGNYTEACLHFKLAALVYQMLLPSNPAKWQPKVDKENKRLQKVSQSHQPEQSTLAQLDAACSALVEGDEVQFGQIQTTFPEPYQYACLLCQYYHSDGATASPFLALHSGLNGTPDNTVEAVSTASEVALPATTATTATTITHNTSSPVSEAGDAHKQLKQAIKAILKRSPKEIKPYLKTHVVNPLVKQNYLEALCGVCSADNQSEPLVDLVRALLKHKDSLNYDINDKLASTGLAPIHYAAQQGHRGIYALLLENGADKSLAAEINGVDTTAQELMAQHGPEVTSMTTTTAVV